MNGLLTCPECGHRQSMQIPEGSCQAFYQCGSCHKIIKAGKSCCVFCDFGDRRCQLPAENTGDK